VTGPNDPSRPLRLAGRIALATGLAALLVLVIIGTRLGDAGGTDYLSILRARALDREVVSPLLLLAGLILLAVAGFITWLVTLQASFLYAGPLYRLRRNLDEARQLGPQTPTPLRRGDALTDEYGLLEEALAQLRDHDAALESALQDLAAAAHARPDAPLPYQLPCALREVIERARV
jgi:hypothetical protein